MTQETTALPPSLTRRVATEIRAELGRQQMSQRKLAELLNTHPALFSRRITGTSRPFTTDELDRIANALGVSVDKLLGTPAASLAGAA